MRKIRKSGATLVLLLTVLCVAAVGLYASYFIVVHAGHRCVGMECYTCALIHRWSDAMEKLYAGILAMVVSSASLLLARSYLRGRTMRVQSGLPTLVELGVRLNT